MKEFFLLLLVFGSTTIYGQRQTAQYSELYLDSIYQGDKGTFVLYHLQKDSYQVYNTNRAKIKFAVHSTSKILWSLIGLEEGLIQSEADIVVWDSVKYPSRPEFPTGFYQDHTIVTALKYSVNWYYMELLKLMPSALVEEYLNKLDYQKDFHVEKTHYFGLTFNIKKSAFEQIEFLKGIYLNEYDLSAQTLDIIKKGMLYNSNPGLTLYTKTGLGPIANGNGIGWLIGWIEKGSETFIFAFNLEDEDELKPGKLRYDYSIRVLKALNILELKKP